MEVVTNSQASVIARISAARTRWNLRATSVEVTPSGPDLLDEGQEARRDLVAGRLDLGQRVGDRLDHVLDQASAASKSPTVISVRLSARASIPVSISPDLPLWRGRPRAFMEAQDAPEQPEMKLPSP